MSDRVMQMLRSQRGTEAPEMAAPPPGEGGAMAPPMAAPMSTPEPKMGTREGPMINVGMAMDLIEQSLPSIGSETEEGQKLVAALRSLTGVMGPRRSKVGELQNAEILQLLQQLPQAGGATPEMKAMAGMPAVPGMAGGPPPGAPPPGGMPPGMPPIPPPGGMPPGGPPMPPPGGMPGGMPPGAPPMPGAGGPPPGMPR
jgi:hypothetical protein